MSCGAVTCGGVSFLIPPLYTSDRGRGSKKYKNAF